jgi:hypothetical protein
MTPHNPSHDDLITRVHDALNGSGPGPARLDAMRTHIASAPVRGGTTLRPDHRGSRWWIAGGVLAAAAAVIMIIALPAIDRRTTLSAAEILGRTRAALATQATGIEVLTYDLSVDGVLADLLPVEQSGRLTVEETIDHDHPGRYRLRKLGPGGEVVGAIADDPMHGIRARYLRAHGRGYLLRFTEADPAGFSFPAVKRMALQAFITLMQAESDQALRETTCEGEACYEVTIPQSVAASDVVVSLTQGRALVTAADSRLIEFSVTGHFLQRPFGIEFALRQRDVRAATSVTDTDFDIVARPGDVVLQGDASSNPMWDIVERALAAIPEQPRR